MTAKHTTMADAARDGLISTLTLQDLEARLPGYELFLTPPSMTAGGWWRAWGRRRQPDGRWERAFAPWVSHEPDRAARALLGERPAEYDSPRQGVAP